MASKKYAGRVARKVSRKAYRGALKMSKRRLAKVYAQKCGQVAFRASKNKKVKRSYKRIRRRRPRFRRMRRSRFKRTRRY